MAVGTAGGKSNVIVDAKRALPAAQALWLFGDYEYFSRLDGEWLAQRVTDLGVDGVDLRYLSANEVQRLKAQLKRLAQPR